MMERIEKIRRLNGLLLEEMPEYRQQAEQFAEDLESQRRLLRSLMNVRYPGKRLNPEFLRLQDELLAEEREERGIVDVMKLLPVEPGSSICVWQGDITRLKADAIVNAANSQMLGCFIPCHACIDNAIHSAAGLQLRDECMELMQAQGCEEPVGRAKITRGYNLSAKFILHTVGPAVSGTVTLKMKECWNPAIVPAWNWPKPMGSGALRSAVFRRGYSAFQMNWRRRLPSGRFGSVWKVLIFKKWFLMCFRIMTKGFMMLSCVKLCERR